MSTSTHLMTAEELIDLPDDGSRVLFSESDEVTDEVVLPGFRVRVAEIFN